MFTGARIKLTGWYLLIIMTITVFFSFAIFFILSGEIDRGYTRLEHRYEQVGGTLPDDPNRPTLLDPQILDTAKDNIRTNLIYIDLLIFVASATAGYFLAGRTLKPISVMISEENRFITDASHELRTPITALRTSLEVNLRDKNLDFKEARNLLQDNLHEVEQLQALTDNLLLLAKGSNDNDALNVGQADLKEVVESVVTKLTPLARKKKITLESKVGEITLKADSDKLTRLLVILVDNAIKYSSKETKIEVTGKKTDHRVMIGVSDQGIGIKDSDIVHIFDRFYRADSSHAGGTGYGLGLAIAKKIVGQHGGTITVKSGLGKGTTFTILLPLT